MPRRSKQNVKHRAALALTLVSPRLGFAFVRAVGSRVYRRAKGIRPEEVEALLGPLPREQQQRIALEVTTNFYRNRLLRNWVQLRGLEPMSRLVACRNTNLLRQWQEVSEPALLLFGHTGPHLGAVAGLFRAGVSFMLIRTLDVSFPTPPHIQFLNTRSDSGRQALALKQAHDHLRKGGLLLLAIDGSQGGRPTPTDFLGRERVFQKGLSTLYRTTGARLVPVRADWTFASGGMEFTVEDPLPVPKTEDRGTAEVEDFVFREPIRWLERSFRERPEQMRPGRFRKLLSSSPSPEADD
jgi:lauroyl/myristoyl acyltransferase